VPELKQHILPRIRDILLKEATSDSSPSLPQAGLVPASTQRTEHDSVFFKNDCMYRHNIARFNYTTYDVRRAQDVINPGTLHRDIMLLAKTGNTNPSDHPFLYARVLGIYHVNVIYTGEGMLDYAARRVDFLWVRWFNYNGSRSLQWDDFKLDSLSFPPMETANAFGFVDPKDVLRSCHVIPAFASRKVHIDGVALSHIAKDKQDWTRYYVDRCAKVFFLIGIQPIPGLRFADRDMVMRYHWGLGVGHVYSHDQGMARTTTTSCTSAQTSAITMDNPVDIIHQQLDDGNNSDVDNPELGLEDRDDDLGENDRLRDEAEVDCDDDSDEQLLVMDDMYGLVDPFEDYHD
jgi:hypothetical protein